MTTGQRTFTIIKNKVCYNNLNRWNLLRLKIKYRFDILELRSKGMKAFGERLKNLRLNKGLTLKQVANQIGVTDIALKQCERGHYAINITHLISLAKYFEVTLDYLLGLEDDGKTQQ